MHQRREYKDADVSFDLQYDIHLCAYQALLRIVGSFHDEIFSDPNSPSGLNKEIDFRAVTAKHDENLTQYHHEWSRRFAEDSDPNGELSQKRNMFFILILLV